MNISVDVSKLVQNAVGNIKAQLHSRAFRAAQELHTAEVEILRGQRSGLRYSTATSGRKTRDGKVVHSRRHVASAPGEPPAVDSGKLLGSWRPVIIDEITPAIESNLEYAPYLEYGTSKMAARPYKDPIVQMAMPNIEAIYKEPYI